MTETPSISCAACGAPNSPEAGTIHMACAYCGTNLTIPENLRTKAMPKAEKTRSQAKPVTGPEIDAADLLRKAQPAAIRAWNLYALWTSLRWLLPTCLVIFLVGSVLCAALVAVPIFSTLMR